MARNHAEEGGTARTLPYPLLKGMARGIAYHQLKQMKQPTSTTADVSTNSDKELMEPDGKANSHNG